jgi:nitroimidazol reductase NimA-like FMN-containing flavoprotein (pyridoxamine 5'-phosphate oxidase superfamily)
LPSQKKPPLVAAKLDDLMSNTWNLRIATTGSGTRINLTPLWFSWVAGNIYFFCRGQKVENLRRNSNATVLVDRNERFPELQGAMFQGRAVVLEDRSMEDADDGLSAARQQVAAKYAAGGSVAPPHTELTALAGNFRWVRFEPSHTVTWDNTMIPAAL